MDVFRTYIVAVEHVELAKTVIKLALNDASDTFFKTALATPGKNSPEYFISTGNIPEECAAFFPCSHLEYGFDSDFLVFPVSEGNPEGIVALLEENGITTSKETVEAMFSTGFFVDFEDALSVLQSKNLVFYRA